MKISEAKLQIVKEAMDRVTEWALNTLIRLKTKSSTLLMWLKSCDSDHPYPQPFRLPQEPTTVKRYVNHWKQFMFYIIRTSLLDESIRDQAYGIHFTEYQLQIIRQLLEMLNTWNEDQDKHRCEEEEDDDYEDEEDIDFLQYDPDEDDDEDEEGENVDFGDDAEVNDEYSLFLTQVAEKLMQLSIAFITQRFPEGDDLHSPLVHFADVMGISNRFGRFNEAYNYTSYVAGLIWMSRLLVMEYALPSREYAILGWPSHEAYENKGERLRLLHRDHLIQGSFSPMNRLIRVLAIGKETVKSIGRPCLLDWDPDYKGVKIKDIYLQLDAFKQFVQDGIKSTETILREQLFFGMDLPTIDLKSIKDEYGKVEPEYSFLKGSADVLPNGCKFMFNLMKSADPSKHLIDAQGRWNMLKVMEYLKGHKKVLRKLMKGILPVSNSFLLI